MTLADLQEELFSLIEREPLDPVGVDEVLAAVPGGRQVIERTKAALALARLLPIEEPPARLDERILTASAHRA